MKHRRLPVALIATALFVVISFFQTQPSDTSIPDPHQVPGPIDEETSLRELAAWVAQDRSPAPRVQALSLGDLDAALTTSEPRRFALFERDVDDKARRRVLERLPYGSAIWAASRRHRVDGLLVAAIVQAESGFVPEAVSPKGAVGLMQVMPATAGYRPIAPVPAPAPAATPIPAPAPAPAVPTAAAMEAMEPMQTAAAAPETFPAPAPAPAPVTVAETPAPALPPPPPPRSSPLFDPYVNLDTGSRYLRRLLREFDGDLELTLAAYNAGPGAVARYGGIPPFRETREYVRRVLAIYQAHYERAWQGSEAAKDAMSLFGGSSGR